MAMLANSLITKATGQGSYRAEWDSDQARPLFYVWVAGRCGRATTKRSMAFTPDPGRNIRLAVFDDPADRPEQVIAERQVIIWSGTPTNKSYRVERYTGGQWTGVQTVAETGRPYYRALLPAWDDGAYEQIRVVAIGADGNETATASLSVAMARNPDAPTLGYAYDEGTRKITLTDAS